MTVRELIEWLAQVDPEISVLVVDDGIEFDPSPKLERCPDGVYQVVL